MGVILLHPTSNKAAMTKNFARQFSKVAPSGENMALFRRFGHKVSQWVHCCSSCILFISKLLSFWVQTS